MLFAALQGKSSIEHIKLLTSPQLGAGHLLISVFIFRTGRLK